MKLSFTTLGCPDWDLQLIIGRAAEYGFDAIDFRGLNGELQLYKVCRSLQNSPMTPRRQ